MRAATKPPLRIAICEDVESDLRRLTGSIEQSGVHFCLDVYPSGELFLQGFEKGRFDLIFLDVFMAELSGIETAEQIRAQDNEVVIIFTTTSEDFTREGYRLNAYKYMIKPILKQDVDESLDLAMVKRDSRLEAHLDFTSDGKQVSLAFSAILYVESRDSRSYVVSEEGRHYPTAASLDSLESLLTPPRFVRSHRAFIVNLDHVDDVDEDFIMDNGDLAYIRVKDHKRIINAYDDYLFSKVRND